MAKIFISYRRADSEWQTRMLHTTLAQHVDNPREDIFYDLDSMTVGLNFKRQIEATVQTCDVLLAIIGRNWLLIQDEAGNRRLDDPDDFVRLEIAAALARDIRVVPVLLDGTEVPQASALPEDLKELAERHGVKIRADSFDADAQVLIRGLGLGGGGSETKAREAVPEIERRMGVLSDLRETWARFPDRETASAIERFLARVRATAPGTGLEFEVEHALDSLRVEADPKEKARQAAETAARREAEAKAAREAEAARRRTPGAEFRDGEGLPLMVTLPPGRFMMGSPESEEGRRFEHEGAVHEVRIGYPLAVGKFPVTVGEFRCFIQATGHDTGTSAYSGTGLEWKDTPGLGWQSPGFSQDDNHPVTCVSWEDAQAYTTWLAKQTGGPYRLLSEAEWEYAARAGTTTTFHTGATISTGQANYNGNYTYGSGVKGEYRQRTTSVGSFPANAFGLHDMHGNVWEWTQDCWNDSYTGAPTDGSAWTTGDCNDRVQRGGGWDSTPRSLRSAVRGWISTSYRDNSGGFRIAMTL